MFQESLGITGEQIILKSWNIKANRENSITLRALGMASYRLEHASFGVYLLVHVSMYMCKCMCVQEHICVHVCGDQRTALAAVQQASFTLFVQLEPLTDPEFTSNVG